MKIYKHRCFHKWARHEAIHDVLLIRAVHELERGLVDADLGGGLFKKRISRNGQGKRGAYRTLIAFKHHSLCIFVFGFAKSDLEDIGPLEKEVFKKLAKDLLHASEEGIHRLVQINELIEVN